MDVEEGRRGRERPKRAASERVSGVNRGVVGQERSIYMEGMAVIKSRAKTIKAVSK